MTFSGRDMFLNTETRRRCLALSFQGVIVFYTRGRLSPVRRRHRTRLSTTTMAITTTTLVLLVVLALCSFVAMDLQVHSYKGATQLWREATNIHPTRPVQSSSLFINSDSVFRFCTTRCPTTRCRIPILLSSMGTRPMIGPTKDTAGTKASVTL